MTHYFGFLPSDKLNHMIDEAIDIIESNKPVDYYPYRNALTQQITREFLDNLLVNLIDVIPNPERKAAMRKIVATTERAVQTLLGILLGRDSNEDVMPSFYFLKDDSMFIDNDGKRRVGFVLSQEDAQVITEGFGAVSEDDVSREKFKIALKTMNEAALAHFLTGFTATLKLGMIKKKAIPVAKATIDKGISVALDKLLPQLPDAGVNRLAKFYRPYLINKPNDNVNSSINDALNKK